MEETYYYPLIGRCVVDAHADTMCAGATSKLLEKTGTPCDVTGFHPDLKQRGILNLSRTIVRRFMTRQAHLKYNYLKTRVYSDTMHGMTCAQVFVTIEGFVKVSPMRNKAVACDAQNNCFVTVGLPLTIVTYK